MADEAAIYDNILKMVARSPIKVQPRRQNERQTSAHRNNSRANSRSNNVNPDRKNPVTNVYYRNKNKAGIAQNTRG